MKSKGSKSKKGRAAKQAQKSDGTPNPSLDRPAQDFDEFVASLNDDDKSFLEHLSGDEVRDPRVTLHNFHADLGLAEAEAEAFEDESLDNKREKNNFNRTERFQDHLITAAISIFWAGVSIIICTGLVWFYHLLSPVSWHFLNAVQLDKVQAVMFSGVLSACLTGAAKKFV